MDGDVGRVTGGSASEVDAASGGGGSGMEEAFPWNDSLSSSDERCCCSKVLGVLVLVLVLVLEVSMGDSDDQLGTIVSSVVVVASSIRVVDVGED